MDVCKQIRRDLLNISFTSGHGHLPTCFSIVELLQALYGTMRHDPANPELADRDIFVLSKGHAALAYYAVLARQGYFPVEAVASFGSCGATFGCHADRSKIPGVEVSTGSLGHGIGIAVGMALALKIKQQPQRRVYTLVGDGESNEGTVWEAALVAESRRLDNLTVIYDNNRSHSRGLQVADPGAKFAAFGFEVQEVDGHDIAAIQECLRKPASRPKAIIAHTVKGRGCPTMVADQYAWHRRSPKEQELHTLLEELDAPSV
jgi:Transketolase, N-terminal subunit